MLRIAIAGLVVSMALSATGAAGAATPAGRVGIERPNGGALDAGGSATPFVLRLPAGAACPGDSRDGGYRVQSFLVPAGDDPGQLRYKSIAPDGAGRYSLFETSTRSYVQVQTANAEAPGGPGPVIAPPPFTFAVFPPGRLSAGPYEIGLACTLLNETKRYWSTSIEIVSDAHDRPAQFRWRVPDAGSAASTDRGAPGPALLVVLAVGVLSVVVVRQRARRRPRRTTVPRSLEPR